MAAPLYAQKYSLRQYYELLRAQLENERSSFTPHWRDLSDNILPRRARFTVSDVNKGDRRNQKIIDSTATMAAGILSAGMMGGVTSPARPWFKLSTGDEDLNDDPAVKNWLDKVTKLMRTIMLKSNLYNALPTLYGTLGTFATGAMFLDEDLETVFRCYTFPIGSYYISNDAKLRVRVFMRDFRMTVRQLVEAFGYEQGSQEVEWTRFSSAIKSLWDQGALESWVDVCHVIHPNSDWDDSKLEARFKKYKSCYFERGAGNLMTSTSYIGTEDENRYLKESGYDYFPVLVPRWETTGEDAYGTDCPGMKALGDIKSLQLMQKRKSQAIEKSVNPPMVGPVSLKNSRSSIVAGDITFVDTSNDRGGFRPAHEVKPDIQGLLLDIQDHQGRINKAFYADLFLMLAESDRREITAREIDERREEKLLALGPVLEQLNQDLLDPLIDIIFALLVKQGILPEAPKVLQKKPLRVEYISIMAQAQKLVGQSSIDKFLAMAESLAPVAPQALDKIDFDKLIEQYGDIVSIPEGVVRSEESVASIRKDRQQAQQQQAQMEQAAQAAQAAKNLAQAPLGQQGQPNALDQLVNGAQQSAVA